MIAYNFPPEGNAGVYRPLRFVRHLPTLGWEPSVVCADAYSCERYDPDLLNLVPKEIEVIRVRNRDPWQAIQARRGQWTQEKLSKSCAERTSQITVVHSSTLRSLASNMLRSAEAWCYYPDTAMFWIRPAVDATVKLCLRKRASVIWASGPPFSSFIAARRASRQTNVPYVLDFRTSWTLVEDDLSIRRPTWAKRRDRKHLGELFKGAQSAIFAYEDEAECFCRVYQGALEPSKIHIIPNGYEGPIDKFATAKGNKLDILYTGTLSSYRFDTLLQAIYDFKRGHPREAKQLRFLFVGEGVDVLGDNATKLGISEIIETRGPISQAEVTVLQREAHVLLMLERIPTVKGHELLAGAKLFGYLRAGRPILGVLPQGEAKRILQHVGASTVADVDSPVEIVVVLRRLLDAWSGGCLSSLVPDRTACSVYSAEHQTNALVRALEGAPAVTPFVPGSVEVPPSLREDIAKWDGLPS